MAFGGVGGACCFPTAGVGLGLGIILVLFILLVIIGGSFVF